MTLTLAKPFWSSRESSTSLRTIDENIVLSTRIGKDIARATANIDALGTRSAAYTKNVGEGLTPPALAAMRGVSGFVGAVEYLHELVVLAKTAQAEDKPDVPYRAADIKANVERCQAEAKEIERLLGELVAAANKLVPEGEQVRALCSHAPELYTYRRTCTDHPGGHSRDRERKT